MNLISSNHLPVGQLGLVNFESLISCSWYHIIIISIIYNNSNSCLKQLLPFLLFHFLIHDESFIWYALCVHCVCCDYQFRKERI